MAKALGKQQLALLQVAGPSRAVLVTTKVDQRRWDRLVDLGLAAYPPPAKASGKTTIADGGFVVITSRGLAALEVAGLWPHPFGERPEL